MVLGAIGRIPFAAIDRWAERAGVTDSDAFWRLKNLVSAMDRAWIDEVTPKSEG